MASTYRVAPFCVSCPNFGDQSWTVDDGEDSARNEQDDELDRRQEMDKVEWDLEMRSELMTYFQTRVTVTCVEYLYIVQRLYWSY